MAYKPTGRPVGRPRTAPEYEVFSFKAPTTFLTQVRLYAKDHGDRSVAEVIRQSLERSMANGAPAVQDDGNYGNTKRVQHAPADEADDDHMAQRLGQLIVERFGDGKWHTLGAITQSVRADSAYVQAVLASMVSEGAWNTSAERRSHPKSGLSYRIKRVGIMVDLETLRAATSPLLDELTAMATGHTVHFSQRSVHMVTAQLRLAIEKLDQGGKTIEMQRFNAALQPVLDDMEMILNGPRKTDFSRQAMQTAFAQLLKALGRGARPSPPSPAH